MIGPELYLHGPRGDRTIVVPHRFVTALARTGLLQQIRSAVSGADPVCDAVAAALVLAAMETRSGSEVGTRSVPCPEPTAGLSVGAVMTTRAAADELGISARAVVKALHGGRLAGSLDAAGHWRVDRESVRQYRAA